jgi:glycolate oxidase
MSVTVPDAHDRHDGHDSHDERAPRSFAVPTDTELARLVADLQGALDRDRARADPLELSLYARDAGVASGRAAAVCFPRTTAEVAAAVRTARHHDRPFLGRGSGTGLAGGATPVDDPVVIVTTQMNRVLDVDVDERFAWVEPGVLNLDLTRAVSHLGLHYAPDPSSQQACSIGGNVATNAGGPHCLLYGTTQAHVLAVEVVLPDGTVTMVGGLGPDQPGYDLRGVFVGSEGTMGIATRIAVRLMPDPPALRTLLLDFTDVDAAAETVSGIIADGLVPAALEMMDAEITRMVEDFVGAGYPRDAAAVLLVEVDGLGHGVDDAVEIIRRVGTANGARTVRVAADATERNLLWKGRKSAFGAIARIAPNYYLHDTVVPRTRLVEVLRGVYAIADEQRIKVVNVFHAGDGNLHPLLVFDRREPGVMERVHAAGDAIIDLSLSVGGVLSGEHGIGLEKRDHMRLQFSPDDLHIQAGVRDAFDPDGFANPHKVLPAGSRCGDLQAMPDGVWV